MNAFSITDESLRRLYLYWDEKRGARPFPARRDIDPLDFRYLLGWILLLDVSHAPLRFNYRIYGTEIGLQEGLELTGKSLDEHPRPETRRELETAWRQVVETGVPVYEVYERETVGSLRNFEALRLPMSSDGRVIDMLLVAVSPQMAGR